MPDLQRTRRDIKAGFNTVGSEVQLVTLNKIIRCEFIVHL